MKTPTFDRWMKSMEGDRNQVVLTWGRDAFISDQLRPSLETFNKKVWTKGLYDRIKESKIHGMTSSWVTATGYSFEFHTFDIAGRIMLTLADGTSQVTYIADSDYADGSRTGLQSFEGDIFKVKEMFDQLILLWPTTSELQRAKHKDAPSVGMG